MIKTRERVIIDTDPGIDDALALLLALRSPELEVVAITTVNGNVSLDMATRNAFTVLSLIPPGQRPPVAAGAPAPLEKTPYFATFVHGDDGLGKLDRYRDASGRPRYAPVDVPLSARSAVEEILFHVSSAEPQAMTLIAIGPLTNVAQALERDRDTMARLKRIVVMGGAISVSGNVTPAAEFNIYVDPLAARRVFHAGIPLTVVGLDVTRRVRLTRKTVETEVAPRQTEISQFVCDCTSDLLGFCENREGKASFPLHDPLAIGVLIDPSLVSLEPMHIEVETKGELTEGMTLADRRPIRSELKEPPNAEVCVDVDASRFLALFLGRLCPK
jgi:purine nucleosidase/pyrimidine-specific ribonucleoside hydrolase